MPEDGETGLATASPAPVGVLDLTQHLDLWDFDFTAFEIKCSSKWQKSLRFLGSALPDGKLLRCLSLCLQGGAWFTNSLLLSTGGIPSFMPPHRANKTLIFEPSRTLSSRQLTWAPGNKYICIYPGSHFCFAGPRPSLSHGDGRIIE